MHHYAEPNQLHQPVSPNLQSLAAAEAHYAQQGKMNNMDPHHYQQPHGVSSSAAAQQQQLQHLLRPNAGNSFSPYYSPQQQATAPHSQTVASAFLGHPQNNAHLMASSPRYSSPPPPGISSLADSVLLGSPIPQQHSQDQYRYDSLKHGKLVSLRRNSIFF